MKGDDQAVSECMAWVGGVHVEGGGGVWSGAVTGGVRRMRLDTDRRHGS